MSDVREPFLKVIELLRSRTKDQRHKLFNAVFRNYLDPSEKNVKFSLSAYIEESERDCFTDKEMTFTADGAYVTFHDDNKKSLDLRLNDFTELLHYSTKCTIEI